MKCSFNFQVTFLGVFFVLAVKVEFSEQHARLLEPPSRASMWRVRIFYAILPPCTFSRFGIKFSKFVEVSFRDGSVPKGESGAINFAKMRVAYIISKLFEAGFFLDKM